MLRAATALLFTTFCMPFASAGEASVHAWPDRPVHVIVPAGVGGVADTRARWLADRLAPMLNQAVIVENRPGAGGNIGMHLAAHSAPDGYTLVIVHQGTMTMNPHLYAQPGYDALVDFVPVTRVGVGPLVLAVSPDVPARTVRELVALAEAKPGQLTFGSPGVGTPPYMASELFKHMAHIDITHVPYRSGGQAAADVVAGHVTMSIDGTNVQLPLIRAGKLRALAVTGPHRIPALPGVPTLAEAGISGYRFEGWVGLAVPAGTPASIVDRLYRDVATVLASSEAHEWLEGFGLEPGAESPAAFSELIREEHAKWGNIIRDSGIRAE